MNRVPPPWFRLLVRFRRLLLFAIVSVSVSSFAGSSPAAPGAAPTGLAALREEYTAALAAIDAEFKPQFATAATSYASGLAPIETKLIGAKRLEDSLVIREEIERVRAGKPAAPLPRNAHTDWRVLRATYDTQMQNITRVIAPKTREARLRYQEKVLSAERALVAAQAGVAELSAFRVEKVCLAIAEKVEQRAYGATPNAPEILEVPATGALLIGFRFGEGGFNGRAIIKSLQPVFLDGLGEKPGRIYGEGARNQQAIAPPGYAVGGLLVKVSNRLDAMSVTFMKLKPGKLELDPADIQQSPWFGMKGGPKPRQIGANGKAVIGIAIRSGADVDDLGLVQPK